MAPPLRPGRNLLARAASFARCKKNILFNGIADAVRAVCPGVSLSTARYAPNAPRVALLLYADDLVILAEDAGQLQRALDAIGAW